MRSKIAIFNDGMFVFQESNLDTDNLQQNDVFIKQSIIAMNELDILNASLRNEKNLGHTACGEVINVGSGVKWLMPGDKVAYIVDKNSFCEYKIIDATKLVKIPVELNETQSAGLFFNGCLAHMVCARAFIIRDGINTIIDCIHTAMSSAIGWMAKKRGAFVIGLTSEDCEILPEVCDVVIYKSSHNLTKDVLSATKNTGAHVYYSGIKPISHEEIFELMTPSGVIVDHLGVLNNIQANMLMQKSLFFTAPSMFDYKTNRSELILTINDIISMNRTQQLPINFSTYQFDKINEAFAEVASCTSKNTVIIKI